MLVVSPIGAGMALTAGWSGVPILSAGAPMKAAALAQLSRSFPGAWMGWLGYGDGGAGKAVAIYPRRGM